MQPEANPRNTSRRTMLEEQLRARGVHDPRLLYAMSGVPRELFVPPELVDQAYADRALPIGYGQTIACPYLTGLMIQALGTRSSDRVLEIGTGSGYASAVLSRLAAQVFTVERIPELAAQASERLVTLGYHGVAVRCGDGSLGWPAFGPYDSILVMASASRIPRSLVAQLVDGGHMVLPLERSDGQHVVRVTKLDDNRCTVVDLVTSTAFEPLVGAQGIRAAS